MIQGIPGGILSVPSDINNGEGGKVGSEFPHIHRYSRYPLYPVCSS